jgi:hypothetical protein
MSHATNVCKSRVRRGGQYWDGRGKTGRLADGYYYSTAAVPEYDRIGGKRYLDFTVALVSAKQQMMRASPLIDR